jgi:hypothetical protein
MTSVLASGVNVTLDKLPKATPPELPVRDLAKTGSSLRSSRFSRVSENRLFRAFPHALDVAPHLLDELLGGLESLFVA